MARVILDEDLVRVWSVPAPGGTGAASKSHVARMLYWGDEIDVTTPSELDDPACAKVNVQYYNYASGTIEPGTLRRKKAGGAYRPLKVRNTLLLRTIFVDVQQGDATIIQLPNREVMVVDVGEAKFLARLLAAMFPFTTAASPLEIDALVVTHGDADHSSGLVELEKAARLAAPTLLRKRIFVKVRRFFHNGLVKGPGTKTVNGEKVEVPPEEVFGQSVKVGRDWFITDLWSDPRLAPAKS
ncbi:MAG TPA: MBL fold metallo-hydrolase, partial [Thermoanaerobaculaceae bacterium]|nr:MBL fold metallo-hydrolase [Thermoanaerobaculaceae bacterium]